VLGESSGQAAKHQLRALSSPRRNAGSTTPSGEWQPGLPGRSVASLACEASSDIPNSWWLRL